MADLERLEPHDERGVIQRIGRDVRALFLDREFAEDFVGLSRSHVGFSGRGGSPNGIVGGRSSTMEVLF